MSVLRRLNMAKGKKFDAAEKHFEKKCIEWRKQIRELEQVNKELHKKLCNLCDEMEKLQMENESLRQHNETLMELKDMSNDDVRTLIKSKESINRLSRMFDVMNKMF